MPRRWIVGVLRRPETVIASGTAALVVAIAVNALTQPAHHPAPLFETRPELRAPAGAAPDALVLALQTVMAEEGAYAGPLDGVAGARTADAIRRSQSRLGLPANGLPSEDLLARLEAAAAGDGELGVEEDAPAAASDPAVARVQKALARAAYGPLNSDGVFGPRTRDAIIRFQSDHGLEATGEITDSLLVELRATGALESE